MRTNGFVRFNIEWINDLNWSTVNRLVIPDSKAN